MGSGMSYTVQDDLEYLEQQREKDLHVVRVQNKNVVDTGTVSEYSWDAIEKALKDAGLIKGEEAVKSFEATVRGIKVKFGRNV